LATSCRSLTGRTRPDIDPKAVTPGWYGPYHNGKILIGVPSHNSFPSGHTATAVGLAAAILYSRPRWGIPCMFIALSIAASRLYLGKHHLSDVAVSLILGLTVAWGVWKVSRKMEPARF
jgi:membrane-associated phospholipid phosphatase